jgi:hypothetical protein
VSGLTLDQLIPYVVFGGITVFVYLGMLGAEFIYRDTVRRTLEWIERYIEKKEREEEQPTFPISPAATQFIREHLQKRS